MTLRPMLPGLSDGLSRKTQGHEAEGHFLDGQCQQILLAQHGLLIGLKKLKHNLIGSKNLEHQFYLLKSSILEIIR